MSSRNPKRRVKVYELNADGQWTDRGTGFVQVTFTEPTQETFFVVKSEVNEDELLLQSRVYTEDVYQLQQGWGVACWRAGGRWSPLFFFPHPFEALQCADTRVKCASGRYRWRSIFRCCERPARASVSPLFFEWGAASLGVMMCQRLLLLAIMWEDTFDVVFHRCASVSCEIWCRALTLLLLFFPFTL